MLHSQLGRSFWVWVLICRLVVELGKCDLYLHNVVGAEAKYKGSLFALDFTVKK